MRQKPPEFTSQTGLETPEKQGIIPGLKGLAGGASSIMDLFFQAKKLAKAEDAAAAQRALDGMAKTEETKAV